MSLKVRRNACLCCGTCEVCSQQIIDKYHYCPDELTTTEKFLSLSYPPPNHSDFYDYIKENSNKILRLIGMQLLNLEFVKNVLISQLEKVLLGNYNNKFIN